MSVETNESKNVSESQLDKIVKSLEMIIEMQDDRDQREQDHYGSVTTRLSAIEDSLGMLSTGTAGDGEENEPESQGPVSWQDQKLSLLTEHGILTEDVESELASPSPAEANEESDSVCDIEHPAPADPRLLEPEEIEQLRAELTGKLREVEVEIGIKQAKLAQQEARIEERMAQLEKREAEILKSLQLNEDHPNDPSTGVLGRLKQHLNVMAMMRGNDQPSATD